VDKFINMRFEPSGITNDPDIRFASSLVDYVFRRLALDYLPEDRRLELGIRSVSERKVEATNGGNHAEAGPAPAGGSGTTTEPDPPPQAIDGTSLRLSPKAPAAKVVDAPFCYSCGSKMQPAGSCYVCTACGSTSGCS
jgi:ribonucleoside-diphosphate reductase alpha chain